MRTHASASALAAFGWCGRTCSRGTVEFGGLRLIAERLGRFSWARGNGVLIVGAASVEHEAVVSRFASYVASAWHSLLDRKQGVF